LPRLNEVVRPIYVRLGILPAEARRRVTRSMRA
jgi:hypothetical protein